MDTRKAKGLAEAIAALRVAADRLGALGDALGAPEALTLRLRATLDHIAAGGMVDAEALEGLRQMGLAERRAGHVALTPRGADLLEDIRQREDAVLNEIASGLSVETIAALIPALGALNVELDRVVARLELEDAQQAGKRGAAPAS